MGITRRHRINASDKENMACNRESRPWDNDTSLKLLPPVSRTVATTRTEFENNTNRLNDFTMAPVSVLDRMRVFEASAIEQQKRPQDHGLPTRLGNRIVKPLLDHPRAPPLVGLPIPRRVTPPAQPATSNKQKSSQGIGNTTNHNQAEKPSSSVSVSSSSSDVTSQDDSNSSKKSTELEMETPPGPNSSSYRTAEHLICPPRAPSAEMRRKSNRKSRQSMRMVPPVPPPPPLEEPGFDDSGILPRFSFRHSIRLDRDSVAALDALNNAPRASFRHSRRIGETANKLSFLPQSSSFLDFNDDSRLGPLDDDASECTRKKDSDASSSVWKDLSFDEVDSFDTFGSIPEDIAPKKAPPALPRPVDQGPRLESNKSEQPVFPAMSFSKKSTTRRPDRQTDTKGREEEDDGALDMPMKMARRPDAEGALKDLQRASITAGREIAESLRMEAAQVKIEEKKKAEADNISKVQGDLLLKSRILRRWNLRYASIVHQGYFGAVLLLFRPESRGTTQTLKSSKMIALTECIVKKAESSRKNTTRYVFELKTSQRTYTFGCDDLEGRDFWVSSLVRHGVRYQDS